MSKPVEGSASRLIQVAESIISQVTENLPAMQKTLILPMLNQYLKIYQQQITDEKANMMLQEIKKLLEFVESGEQIGEDSGNLHQT